MTTITRTDIVAVLDKAREHILRFGYSKHYLYSTVQAGNGLPLNQCAADVIGAINVAVYGTPRHIGGDPLTQAVEREIEARLDAPSIAAWCSYRGNGKNEAIWLLRSTADQLRREGP